MASKDCEAHSSNNGSVSLAEKDNEADSSDRQALVPPNGGARAWACVAGSFLLQFCSFGYVNA